MRITSFDYEEDFLNGDEDFFEKFSHKTKLIKKDKQDAIQLKRKAKMKERERLIEEEEREAYNG